VSYPFYFYYHLAYIAAAVIYSAYALTLWMRARRDAARLRRAGSAFGE